MWQRYFGLGLVETEADFGSQGSPPSHPRLLDWLASEFVRRDWGVKAMHRLIITSATYRQSSEARPRGVRNRPRQPASGPAEPAAPGGRDYPGCSPGRLRPAGLPPLEGRGVFPPRPEGSGQFTQVNRKWTTGRGTQPLPPRHVHLLSPLGCLPGLDHVRRPQRSVYRDAPQPLQHTAAGIDSSQRSDPDGVFASLCPGLRSHGEGSTRSHRIRYAFERFSGSTPECRRRGDGCSPS